jgi:hypothetical protein
MGGTIVAWHTAMMTTLLIVAALLAGVFFVEVIAASSAPVGYEDESGFHFGPEEVRAAEEASYPQGVGCLNPS